MALFKWFIQVFLILMLCSGFVSLYLFFHTPSKMLAFSSVYVFFLLANTFIFTIILKIYVEFFAEARTDVFLDKSLNRVLSISFLFSTLGAAAELFFFLETERFVPGSSFFGILFLVMLLLSYYSLMMLFYDSEHSKIIFVGVIMLVFYILTTAFSRIILTNLMARMGYISDIL